MNSVSKNMANTYQMSKRIQMVKLIENAIKCNQMHFSLGKNCKTTAGAQLRLC